MYNSIADLEDDIKSLNLGLTLFVEDNTNKNIPNHNDISYYLENKELNVKMIFSIKKEVNNKGETYAYIICYGNEYNIKLSRLVEILQLTIYYENYFKNNINDYSISNDRLNYYYNIDGTLHHRYLEISNDNKISFKNFIIQTNHNN